MLSIAWIVPLIDTTIMSRLTIVVAATISNGIGKNGTMPWHISKDLKFFAHVTSDAPEGKQNAVVMGRNTWESIPAKNRPLKGRLNVVLSHNPHYSLWVKSVRYFFRLTQCSRRGTPDAAAVLVGGLKSALDYVGGKHPTAKPVHRGFIIGGASIINETLDLNSTSSALVDRVLLTRILSPDFECDTFMPNFLASGEWTRSSHADLKTWVGFDVPEGVQTENETNYEFQMWTRNVQGRKEGL